MGFLDFYILDYDKNKVLSKQANQLLHASAVAVDAGRLAGLSPIMLGMYAILITSLCPANSLPVD